MRAKRPSILYILADDQGYRDVGCLNPNCKAPTPVLDGLARDGMRFTDSRTSSAVCTPAGPCGDFREATLHHPISGHFSIRRGKWKLLEARGSGGWSFATEALAKEWDLPSLQLHDLEKDPRESTNLAGAFPGKAAELQALLKRYRSEGRSVPAETRR